MIELNASELASVSGGLAPASAAGEFFAGGGAAYGAEAFASGVIEGAELGSAFGPVGTLVGLAVGAAVVGIWEMTD